MTLIKKLFTFSPHTPVCRGPKTVPARVQDSKPFTNGRAPRDLPAADSHCDKMRWGIVGFNNRPFVYVNPTKPDAHWLVDRVKMLGTKKLHPGAGRDLAGGLDTALTSLLAYTGNRKSLVFITDGVPTSTRLDLQKVFGDAVEYGVGIHGIVISPGEKPAQPLADICTKKRLGYGSLYWAKNSGEFKEALRESVRSVIPKSWIQGHNRCVFVLDFSSTMAAPLDIGQRSKMNLVSQALAALIQEQTSPNHGSLRTA